MIDKQDRKATYYYGGSFDKIPAKDLKDLSFFCDKKNNGIVLIPEINKSYNVDYFKDYQKHIEIENIYLCGCKLIFSYNDLDYYFSIDIPLYLKHYLLNTKIVNLVFLNKNNIVINSLEKPIIVL